MECEAEGGSSGCFPEFGAIFMSSPATKRECIKRNLLGLPPAQENFVKRVKAGMILFIFEFEKRELHGVYRACSDGAMDIVPNAFTSSGGQFPAQVPFSVIWHCNPLSEHEFRDAISENYYSYKKFNFGLSKDQVRRLLRLFSLRKSGSKVPRSHFGERILGNEKIIIKNREEKFVENGSSVHTIKIKYNGNSPSDGQRLDKTKFSENSLGYDSLTEHEGSFLDRRKGVSEIKINLLEDKLVSNHDLHAEYSRPISNYYSTESLYGSMRERKENQFLFRDTGKTDDIRDVVSQRARRDLNDGRVQIRDIIEDKYTPKNDGYPFGKLGESFEIPQTEIRRPIDDQDLFMDRNKHYNYNSLDNPKSIIDADQVPNSLGRVRRLSDDSQIHISDRIEVAGMVNDGIVSDKLDYSNLYKFRPQQPSFSPSKPTLEAHYSLSQNQHNVSSPFRRSYYPILSEMEKNNSGVSYPSRDSVLTRYVSYDSDYSEVNGNSHRVQDFVCNNSRDGNDFSASIKPSYCAEYEDLSPRSDVAFRRVSEVPLRDYQDLYDDYDGKIRSYYSSGGYCEKMKRQSIINENCEDPLSFGCCEKMEQPSITNQIYEDRISFSRSPMYVRRNISPSIEFNEFSLASQERVNHKFLENVTDLEFSDHQERMVNYGMEFMDSSKFNDYDIGSYRDQDRLTTDLKNRRTSVFSRLSKSSRKRGQKKEDYTEYDLKDYSVDQVMETLFESLGPKMTKAGKHSPLGKRKNTEDILVIKRREKKFIQKEADEPKRITQKMVIKSGPATENEKDGKNTEDSLVVKRREKRISQLKVDEPQKINQKMATEFIPATGDEENEKDIARETRVLDFKRRSDINRSLTEEKEKGFTGTEGLVQKPEGERERENEGARLKRRKLVRPVFGKKENNGSKSDAYLNPQLTLEISSCNSASCGILGRSLGDPSPYSRVHKKLVRPGFDKKEKSNENTKRDEVSDLLIHESPDKKKAAISEFSDKTVDPNCPSPNRKENLDENIKGDGVSDLLTHESLDNQKPAPSVDLNCPFLEKEENSNENLKRDGVYDLLAHESLDNEYPATFEFSGKTVEPNSLSPEDKNENSNENLKRDGVSDLLTDEILDYENPATFEFSGKAADPNCSS